MSKGQTLQDPPQRTQKERVQVSIYLVNGIKLQGQIIRPVRRTAQTIADGLRRHLNSCSRPQRSYPDRCERGRGCLTLIASASQ